MLMMTQEAMTNTYYDPCDKVT